MEFATIDSTNSQAQRLARRGERGPLWLRADRQEDGRGRSGRSWSSPAGNLSATFMFSPACTSEYLHQLALVAGIAACDTIKTFLENAESDSQCRIKWPNDLMIGTAKAGGILIESTTLHGQCLAIVGCGINISVKPVIADREVTAMAEHGAAPNPSTFLEQLDQYLYDRLKIWNNGIGFAAIRQAWLQRTYPCGSPMSVNTADKLIYGTFAGIAEDGALLLSQGSAHYLRFNFGDVVIGRNAAQPVNGDNDKN
ncbi:MAG: biotin--[acetyl-CoA-carboxylase] ligase [Pseudomonadota bacterium]